MSQGRSKKRIYLYLAPEMVAEIDDVARRLDRSRNWVIQRAWSVAREELDRLAQAQPPPKR